MEKTPSDHLNDSFEKNQKEPTSISFEIQDETPSLVPEPQISPSPKSKHAVSLEEEKQKVSDLESNSEPKREKVSEIPSELSESPSSKQKETSPNTNETESNLTYNLADPSRKEPFDLSKESGFSGIQTRGNTNAPKKVVVGSLKNTDSSHGGENKPWDKRDSREKSKTSDDRAKKRMSSMKFKQKTEREPNQLDSPSHEGNESPVSIEMMRMIDIEDAEVGKENEKNPMETNKKRRFTVRREESFLQKQPSSLKDKKMTKKTVENAKKLRKWVKSATGFDPEARFHQKSESKGAGKIDLLSKMSICQLDYSERKEDKLSVLSQLETDLKFHRMTIVFNERSGDDVLVNAFRGYLRKGSYLKTVSFCFLLLWFLMIIFDVFLILRTLYDKYITFSGSLGIFQDIVAEIILVRVIVTSDRHPVFPTKLEINFTKHVIHIFLGFSVFLMLGVLLDSILHDEFGSIVFIPFAKGVVFWLVIFTLVSTWSRVLEENRAEFLDLVARKPDVWLV